MANKIILKKTSTASKVPLSTDLEVGEIAVNLADQKLYSKNAGGTVILVGSGTAVGDVVGGASSTDNALARYDGTTGKVIQNSTVVLDDNGNLSNVNSVGFDTTPATVPAVVGTMSWDDGDGVPSTLLKGGNTTLQVGTQEYARVFNDSGTTLTIGQVVYISGAQGNRVAVKLAKADVEATSFGTIGIVSETIANGAEGFIIVSGALYKLNTTGLTAGATVYLSPTTAGAVTTTKPQAPNQLVVLGWVERVHASVGSIYVKIDNGYELDELHDVQVTSPQSGNILIYDASTTPIGVWKNAFITAGTGVSVTNGAGSITITNSDRGSSQNIFKNIAVSGQSTVVADSNDDTVTLVNGTGVSITTNATTDAITITNTAPDQTVALTGAGATTVTGTYPNFTISSVNTTYSQATSTTLGLIELGSDTVQTVAPNAVTATASRSYALQLNSAGQAMVNVPWTDTNSGGTVTSVGGTGTVNGITLSGTVTSSGNLTLGGTLSGVSLSTQVTGTLPIANGGTGATTRQDAMDALAGAVTSGQYLRGNGTDVVMSAIQAGDVPTLNQNTTGSAGTLTTGRTIAITGDLTYTSGSFNGSANVTGTGTLATVNSNVGSFGSSTAIPVVTVNAKGLVTAVSTATVAGGQYFGNATVKAIAYNANSIGENVTVTAGNNGLSAGPITISNGFTVTVQTGANWVIV